MSGQVDRRGFRKGACSADVTVGAAAGGRVASLSTQAAIVPGGSNDAGISLHFAREQSIAALASRQHGVVGRSQLVEAGVPAHVIDHRVRRGRLQVLHRGVYRVGPLISVHGAKMAAVLACGQGAVLSHRSAALLWQQISPSIVDEPVDVSVPRGYRAPARGIRVHRVPGLGSADITHNHGIPLTAPLRTLLDLATVVGERELEQAVARTDRMRLATPAQVASYLEAQRGRAGTRRLLTILEREAGPAFTRSEAEVRFLSLVRKAELPAPEVNVVVEGFEVDFLWRRERLVVEIDGQAFHASATAFERDRHRDAVLAAAGLRVVRITWRQLTGSAEAVLVRLGRALAV